MSERGSLVNADDVRLYVSVRQLLIAIEPHDARLDLAASVDGGTFVTGRALIHVLRPPDGWPNRRTYCSKYLKRATTFKALRQVTRAMVPLSAECCATCVNRLRKALDTAMERER